MAKLPRVTAKVFASNADAADIGQYGSALAGTKLLTSDISTIQALPAYETGWRGAVISTHNYPTLQEMNGLQKTFSQQIAYNLQQGIPEWDSGTTYYKNGFCSKDGVIYFSLIDNNINNDPINNDGNWQEYQSTDKYLVAANINGSTWYRIYSDGWKEQGGILTSSATTVAWTQPRITTNSGVNTSIGTLGGSSFAVACSHIRNSSGPLSAAFDGVIPSSGTVSTANFAAALEGNASLGGNWMKVYTPTAIVPSAINVYWSAASSATRTTTLTIEASNDGSSWTTLSSGTTSQASGSGYATIANHTVDLSSNTTAYKYYRIENTTPYVPSQALYNLWYVCEVKITATYTTTASNAATFPISFSDTNYTVLFSCEGASGSSAYITNKTSSGFSLGNAPTGRVNWYACGY